MVTLPTLSILFQVPRYGPQRGRGCAGRVELLLVLVDGAQGQRRRTSALLVSHNHLLWGRRSWRGKTSAVIPRLLLFLGARAKSGAAELPGRRGGGASLCFQRAGREMAPCCMGDVQFRW